MACASNFALSFKACIIGVIGPLVEVPRLQILVVREWANLAPCFRALSHGINHVGKAAS